MIRRVCGALVIAALLASCAAVHIAPRDPEPFDLLGRVLASYSGGAVTANVRWQHVANRDEIWLMTPTGQTLAYIVDTPAGVVLTRADQQEHRAGSVEALTRQVLGWPLPLSQLQYWIRGMPAPGASAGAFERDASKRLTKFTQNDWRVALTYHETGEYAGKVRLVDLVDGPNRIRFVVDTWRSTSGG
ncbi:MAG TPA: lipoprotein insertase outer membrane protein LolB [Burkholderiales bacterium]|nr:lipoprotein insertase outer membrane protein LolB [Burkholderiales bacterium]